MHASIEQLLRFRDGDGPTASVRAHIGRCHICQERLTRLRVLGKELRALPELSPPEAHWERIRGGLSRQRNPARTTAQRVMEGLGLAALAAIVVFSLGLIRHAIESTEPGPAGRTAETDSAALASLVAESRRKEALLRLLPEPPAVVRAGTAATIEELQRGIALVDYQLSHRNELGLTVPESRRLWQQRVDLLSSLANLRYVEAQQVF